MKRIQSKNYKTETQKISKISLSYFDDKRLVLDDGIHSLAYFHKDLKKIKGSKRFSQMYIDEKRFSQRITIKNRRL